MRAKQQKQTGTGDRHFVTGYIKALAVFLSAGYSLMSIFSEASFVFLAGGAVFLLLAFLSEKTDRPLFRRLLFADVFLSAVLSLTSLSGQLAYGTNSILKRIFVTFSRNVTLFGNAKESSLALWFLGGAFSLFVLYLCKSQFRALRIAAIAAAASAAVFSDSVLLSVTAFFGAAVLMENENRAEKMAVISRPLMISAFVFILMQYTPIAKAAEDYAFSARYSVKNTSDSVTQLEVTMKNPEPVYLHGFLGYEYDNGKWSEPRLNDNDESIRAFAYLKKQGINADNQASLLLGEGSEKNSITVRNISADRRYYYLPYTTEKIYGTDYPAMLENRQSFFNNENVYTADFPSGSFIYDSTYVRAVEENDSGAEYQLLDSIYKESFTAVPEKVERILDTQLSDYSCEEGSLKAAGEVIYSFLGGFEYVSSTDGDEKITAEDFLQQTHSGGDKSFASAAVLIFRYYGVPARYAEGYIADIEKTSGAISGSAISLGERDRHAWAEYYLEGAGWIPFEACPAYFDRMPVPEGVTIKKSDLPEAEQMNGVTEETEELSGERLAKEIKDREEKPEKKHSFGFVFWIAAIFAAAVSAAVKCRITLNRMDKSRGFALKKCAELLSDICDLQPDNAGMYDFSSIEDDKLKHMLHTLQTEYIEEFYSGHSSENSSITGSVAFEECCVYAFRDKSPLFRLVKKLKVLL